MRCDEVAEAEEKLQSLLPGILSDEVSTRVKSEIQNRNIKSDATCITGIELHLKTKQYHRARRGAVDDTVVIIKDGDTIVIIIVKD